MIKKCIAEFLGTAVLVITGCGVALSHTCGTGTGYVGIALAFGLAIVALAYSIGNISGCHVNPAVSLAMLINKKLSVQEFVGYVIAQFLGAIVGAFVLVAIFSTKYGLGTNGFETASQINVSLAGAILTEIILTFIFVFAICGVTSRESFGSVSGVVIGLSLTLVHLIGLPITGTSVNPARSFGPALAMAICGQDTQALSQVWVFIVAPLIGGALAALAYTALDNNNK
jgi:aquaporin Z